MRWNCKYTWPGEEREGGKQYAPYLEGGSGARAPVDVITTDYFLEQRTFPPKMEARMSERTALCGGIRFE